MIVLYLPQLLPVLSNDFIAGVATEQEVKYNPSSGTRMANKKKTFNPLPILSKMKTKMLVLNQSFVYLFKFT